MTESQFVLLSPFEYFTFKAVIKAIKALNGFFNIWGVREKRWDTQYDYILWQYSFSSLKPSFFYFKAAVFTAFLCCCDLELVFLDCMWIYSLLNEKCSFMSHSTAHFSIFTDLVLLKGTINGPGPESAFIEESSKSKLNYQLTTLILHCSVLIEQCSSYCNSYVF